MRRSYALVAALLVVGCASSRQMSRPLPPSSPSDAQRAHVLRTVAGFRHLGFQVVAARLHLGVDTALAWRQLDTLVGQPTGDMFWMYPAVGFYLNLKPRLDEGWRSRFRETWKSYTPYRGDTENHFLMYYASLLLMTQEWPDLPGSEWFNGKSSRENHDEAKGFLEHWIDDVSRHGLTEWDSPRYAYYYITPLILLRDFTADERLRRRCEMMLELMLADYAVEYLEGSYVGAHSRDSDGAVIDPRRAEVSSYGQLYFTDSISFVLPDLAYAAMSSWRCPPIIRAIAHDRDSSYVHAELKRSRARMRYSSERYSTAYKVTYMTPDYALGSIQGGVHQPIQQHTWDVTFAAPRPNNTLFALHPTWSARELGTFFPEEPELMVEGVARAKASYTNENKWIGGSPHESIAQDASTLIASYAIPESDPARHVDLFIPLSADTVVQEMNGGGWWFVAFGDALVAVGSIGAGEARESIEGAHRRVRVHASTEAPVRLVVSCARRSEISFERFVEHFRRPDAVRLERDTIVVTDALGVERRFVREPGGDMWSSVSGRSRRLFDGPHMRSEAGSAAVTLTVDGHERILDFPAAEIRGRR